MYFGLGGHPGFNVPLVPGKTFEDYRLRFAEVCEPYRVGFDESCFVTHEDVPFALENGTDLALGHQLFDDDAIVLRNMAREVTLECEGDSHSVTVRYPGMQYLGLWHWPKTDAPYICIEPWCSLPADAGRITVFEEQRDLIALEPGRTYTNDWTITISYLCWMNTRYLKILSQASLVKGRGTALAVEGFAVRFCEFAGA